MPAIRTEIEIHAPAEAVWAVLTDFAAYPEWSTFVERIEGPLEPGARLRVRLAPPGGRAIGMRPKLLRVDAPHELRWLGRLGLPGIFDGEHRFEITPLGDGRVRLVQAETFRGILVPFLRAVRRRAAEGFVALNEALKARAEGLAADQTPVCAAATRAATSTGSHTGENGGA
ncbi:MAG: SRPBCC family protein [Acidimicrobiia bacterium]